MTYDEAENIVMSYLRDEGATKEQVIEAVRAQPELGRRIHKLHFFLFFSEPHERDDFDEDTD